MAALTAQDKTSEVEVSDLDEDLGLDEEELKVLMAETEEEEQEMGMDKDHSEETASGMDADVSFQVRMGHRSSRVHM